MDQFLQWWSELSESTQYLVCDTGLILFLAWLGAASGKFVRGKLTRYRLDELTLPPAAHTDDMIYGSGSNTLGPSRITGWLVSP